MVRPTSGQAPLEGMLTIKLKKAYHLIRERGARLSPLAMRMGRYLVFSMLKETPGITAQQIADRLFVRKAVIAQDLAQLEEMGWIVRQVGTEDRRRKLLSPTKKGLAAFQEAWPAFVAAELDLKATLTRDEVELLERLLDRLIDAGVSGQGPG